MYVFNFNPNVVIPEQSLLSHQEIFTGFVHWHTHFLFVTTGPEKLHWENGQIGYNLFIFLCTVPDFFFSWSSLNTSKWFWLIPAPKQQLVTGCNQQHMIRGMEGQWRNDSFVRGSVHFTFSCLEKHKKLFEVTEDAEKQLFFTGGQRLLSKILYKKNFL